MIHRFYCPQLPESGAVVLEQSEAHHLSHVLRHQPGDWVKLFNGMGRVATCRVDAISKRSVSLALISSDQDAPRDPQVVLATAAPKGDRFDWLVEKSTELGVRQLIPLVTQRSIVDPRSSKLDKLRQTVISACKQSGRNDLMTISEVQHWPDFLQQVSTGHALLIAHPQGENADQALSKITPSSEPIVIAIGPEGGFTDEEVKSAMNRGGRSITLGQQLLRIETAAIALAAKLLI